MTESLNFEAIENRLPPHNIEAEESILGGILLDPDAIGRIAELLLTDAFYITAHTTIYEVMLSLYRQGRPTDLISVASQLRDFDQLEKVGGQAKLVQLLERTLSAVNIDQYAALVMDKYLRRQLIKAGREIEGLGFDTSVDLEVVLDRAEQQVFNVTQKRPQQDLVPIFETLIGTFEEIEAKHESQTQPGILTDFYDFDAMTGGLQPSDLIIVAGRPSMGKCLHKDALILQADGSLVTIADLYQRQQAELLTLNPDGQFCLTQASDFIDDGIKPVFRVKTGLGRWVETTLTHPFLTPLGWQALGMLNVGDQIAVPQHLDVFGVEVSPLEELQAIAEEIAARSDFSHYLSTVETLTCVHASFTPATLTSIPDFVFKLTKPLLAKLINKLFKIYLENFDLSCVLMSSSSQDWVIDTSLNYLNQPSIYYHSFSQTIIQQLQHLLLRFGILSRIQTRQVLNKKQNLSLTFWLLEVTESEAIIKFLEEFSKDSFTNFSGFADLSQISRSGILSLETSSLDLEKNAVATIKKIRLSQTQKSEIYWDKIVEIEPIGDHQVYDLTIPKTHNFVANDICVHNTAVSLNIAQNIAKNYRLPIAVFSLEMSKEQLVQRLLASEASIEANRLRAGRVSQNEWEAFNNALTLLSELPIYIDDTPNIVVSEIRSKCRRLQAEKGQPLGLVLLDYLQLMEGGGDNRVQELSRITRSLKGLARELNTPVIALSQLSRGVEARNNKRPMMSDLRESGCLAGDTLIAVADCNQWIPLRDLVKQFADQSSNKFIDQSSHQLVDSSMNSSINRSINSSIHQSTSRDSLWVWAWNEQTQTFVKALVSNAFSTGIKPIFELKTRSGQVILATANHRFKTVDQWLRLDQLQPGTFIALSENHTQLLPKLLAGVSPNNTRSNSLISGELGKSIAWQTATIVWDEVLSIEPAGTTEVFDLTVPKYHNFVANNLIVHNSIEQDADLIVMLYRDEYYNPDSPDRGIAEMIIAKHRNGPTGIVKLLFDAQYTRFRNMAGGNQPGNLNPMHSTAPNQFPPL